MKELGFGYACTVEEFYQFMKNKGKENYKMVVQYRDDGGDYNGEDEAIRISIDDDLKQVVL